MPTDDGWVVLIQSSARCCPCQFKRPHCSSLVVVHRPETKHHLGYCIFRETHSITARAWNRGARQTARKAEGPQAEEAPTESHYEIHTIRTQFCKWFPPAIRHPRAAMLSRLKTCHFHISVSMLVGRSSSHLNRGVIWTFHCARSLSSWIAIIIIIILVEGAEEGKWKALSHQPTRRNRK